MPDMTVLRAIKRYFTKPEIEAAYKAALEAYTEKQTSVTITSATFEGGSSSGQIAGDPRELMEVCELILQENEEGGVNPLSLPGTTHVDFSKRIAST